MSNRSIPRSHSPRPSPPPNGGSLFKVAAAIGALSVPYFSADVDATQHWGQATVPTGCGDDGYPLTKTSSCSLPKSEVVADASDVSGGLPSTLYTRNPHNPYEIMPSGCWPKPAYMTYINGIVCRIPVGEAVDIPLPLKIELNPGHVPLTEGSPVCKDFKAGISIGGGYGDPMMQTISPEPGVKVSLEDSSVLGQGCNATITGKVRVSSDETTIKAGSRPKIFAFFFRMQFTRCVGYGRTECEKSLIFADDADIISFYYRYPSGHKPKPQLALKAYLETSSGGSRSGMAESSGSAVSRDQLTHSGSSTTRIPMGGTSVHTTQLPIGGTSLGTTSTLPSPTEGTTVINKLTFEDLQTGLTPNSDYKIRVDVGAEMERLIEKGKLQVGKGPLADLLSTAEVEAEGRTSWAILERGKVYARLIPQGVSDTLEVRVLQGAATQGLLKGLGIAAGAAAASSIAGIGTLVLTTMSPAGEPAGFGTPRYGQKGGKAKPDLRIAISEKEEKDAEMRVQLQWKKTEKPYYSGPASAPYRTGVTVKQILLLLWDARKASYIPRFPEAERGKKNALMNAAYRKAFEWTEARPKNGGVFNDVKRSFHFNPDDKRTPRFDIESIRGHNLQR